MVLDEARGCISGVWVFGYHPRMGGYPDPYNHSVSTNAQMNIRSFRPPRLLILLLVLAGLILLVYMQRPRPSFAEAARFITVLQRFSQDQLQRGNIPESIQIDELISAGYITAKDAQPFVGADISCDGYIAAKGLRLLEGADSSLPPGAWKANPRTILISLRLRDGRMVRLLGDGSIQQLSP